MTTRHLLRALMASAVWILTFQYAPAISADELAKALDRGQAIKLIDLRPKLRFETGSIPGAMNIPASVILEKQLPPLTQVVLFDDGLGGSGVADIVAALNARPGWKTEALEGGFAAWRALQNAPDTAPLGLHPEDVQQISYQDLAHLTEAVVLLDTRPPVAKVSPKAGAAPGNTAVPADPVRAFCGKKNNRSYCAELADLRKRHQTVSRQRVNNSTRPSGQQAGLTPLIVLVDAANTDTRETCRRLRAEGYTRVVVLMGGEEAIQLEGRRGKGRVSGVVGQGSLSTPPSPQAPAAKP